MRVYEQMERCRQQQQKMVAMLIDPDKFDQEQLERIVASGYCPEMILVGGSIVSQDITETIRAIRRICPKTSTVLFPGDYSQLTPEADALLLLSLISGRNAEYLIGQHVIAANRIVRMGLETIPTGYILIDGGRVTSVEYVSGTKPIPSDKTDLIVATAKAGELLGLRAIYLEAGSGAKEPVAQKTIAAVRAATNIPIIVGGGIRTPEAIKSAFDGGADIVVIGTALEQTPEFANSIKATLHQ